MITYHIPARVESATTHNQAVLSTQAGGRIGVDRAMLTLWRQADGCELDDLASNFQVFSANPALVRAALACLAEAGLLHRHTGYDKRPIPPTVAKNALVSIVIVSYNSQPWLEICLPSLFSQNYSPFEIIIVDNASNDGSAEWVQGSYPEVRLVQLKRLHSLAHALNLGISTASGKYFLLINPDVELDPNAIAGLVAVAQEYPNCAAVAAKLKFRWAPAFLNGLGNHVGAFSWGTDNGLGHLDLGQFDGWDEIPSACFAATLIPAAIWNEVGPIDLGFPLYYEDSEWCYRARLLGHSIRAAPQAIVYHAFSARTPTGEENGLTATKLRQVVYGRLRFITKILSRGYLMRFAFSYLIDDLVRFSQALLRGRWMLLRAYIHGWNDFLRALATLRVERKNIQARRQHSDKELFSLQAMVPMPLIRNGLPQLTWDIVCHQYYPLLDSGKSHQIPEFAGHLHSNALQQTEARRRSLWQRAALIWRSEGLTGLLHHLGRNVQWRLAQP